MIEAVGVDSRETVDGGMWAYDSGSRLQLPRNHCHGLLEPDLPSARNLVLIVENVLFGIVSRL